MKVVQATKIIASKCGKKAQVIIHQGEGSARRSFTRHAQFKDGFWIGKNNDPTVRNLHAKAEVEHRDAQMVIDTIYDDIEKAERQKADAKVISDLRAQLDSAYERKARAHAALMNLRADMPLKFRYVQTN